MKKTRIRNKRGRLYLGFGTLLAVLAFIIFAGLSAAAFAASGGTDNNKLPYGYIRIFDPFELKSVPVKVSRSEDEDKGGDEVDPGLNILLFNLKNDQGPIRIPYRPRIRSPYRPPLVPYKYS